MRILIKNKKTYSGLGSYVGRPSPLGNPYSHLKSRTLAQFQTNSLQESLDKYEIWLDEQLRDSWSHASREFECLLTTLKLVGELILICWCAPHPCHAEIIKKKLLERTPLTGNQIE
jgi:hypothetical protein